MKKIKFNVSLRKEQYRNVRYFDITRDMLELREIEGYIIEDHLYADRMKLIVHRSIEDRYDSKKCWSVSEWLTGSSIGRIAESTKNKALERLAYEQLTWYGDWKGMPEQVQKAVNKYGYANQPKEA